MRILYIIFNYYILKYDKSKIFQLFIRQVYEKYMDIEKIVQIYKKYFGYRKKILLFEIVLLIVVLFK